MQIHESRFCRNLRRRKTSKNRLLEHFGYFTARADKDIKHRMLLILMFQQVGDKVRDIINRQTGKSFLVQQSHRLAEIGSAIFQVCYRAADTGDDFLQQHRDGLPRPGIGHRDGDTFHILQRRRTRVERVVIGIQCEDGHDFSRAQTDAGVQQQDKAPGKQWDARAKVDGRHVIFHPDDGESGHPVDDCLCARYFRQPKLTRH